MKYLVLTLLLFTAGYTNAQQLNSDELIEMAKCKDYSCISEMLKARDYSIAYNNETDAFKVYRFNSKKIYANQDKPAISKPNTAELTILAADNSVTFNYYTGSKAERDRLLQEFIDKGFKYSKSTTAKVVGQNVAQEYEREDKDLDLRVTTYARTEGPLRNVGREDKTYMEYGFELQWLTTPPPSKRYKDTSMKKMDGSAIHKEK